MRREVDVVVPGRPSCDLVFSQLDEWPELGREVYAHDLAVAAGAHFNTAAALARLGLRVALVATVGADVWGELVLRDLRAEGLDESFVDVLADVPTPVSVALNRDEDRGFLTYGPHHDRAEAAFVARTRDVLDSCDVRHVHGDLSFASPALLPAARAAGATFSVDAHEAGPWLASPRVRELIGGVDLVFANEAEATAMTEAGDWRAAVRELATWAPHVVVKRGARGAAAAVDGELFEAPTTPVDPVDATGAGDCFVAGYLWAFLRGLPTAPALALGNLCGAAAVAHAGGYTSAPRFDELVAAARDAGLEVA